jgi:hypothetical protein
VLLQREEIAARSPVQRHETTVECMVEAAGVEVSRDVNETERLLHHQGLGVLVDPTGSGVI